MSKRVWHDGPDMLNCPKCKGSCKAQYGDSITTADLWDGYEFNEPDYEPKEPVFVPDSYVERYDRKFKERQAIETLEAEKREFDMGLENDIKELEKRRENDKKVKDAGNQALKVVGLIAGLVTFGGSGIALSCFQYWIMGSTVFAGWISAGILVTFGFVIAAIIAVTIARANARYYLKDNKDRRGYSTYGY
jgi:uncharacterized membrane protein (DUF485 family)